MIPPLMIATSLADIAPTPVEVVRPLVVIGDLFVLLPFTGLYVLGYAIALSRKRRLPGALVLTIVHVLFGAALLTESPLFAVIQIIGGALAFFFDRLVARAARRYQEQEHQSSLSIPSMAPVVSSSQVITRPRLDREG
ncbi:MAG: hypothetical protein R3A51_06180 [Nannocystaceae bacterium]|nr:hypothetical protein [Myxococcales bacterium]